MTHGLVSYEAKGRVAVITLNRPDKLNALNRELGEDLLACWRRFVAADERVAVLSLLQRRRR